MRKVIQKTTEYLFYIFIFILPWQTRWIWHEGILNGQYWEYGSFSLYAVDILLFILLVLAIISYRGQILKLKNYWVILIGLLLISFVSALIALEKDISWYMLGKLIEGFILFWLVFRIKFKLSKVIFSFTLAGLVQSVLAIIQFFSQNIIANKWFGLAKHDPSTLGDLVIETTSGRWLRAYGSFPHPNILAGFLVICLLLVIAALIFYFSKQKELTWQKVLIWLSLLPMYFALILTFSRSAWLVFLLCFLIFLAIFIWQKNKFYFLVLLKIGLILVLLTSITFFMLPDIWETRIMGGRLEQMSVEQRSDYYEEANQLFQKYWYQGVGIGNFTKATYDLDRNREAWDYQPVHNIYYLVVIEIGILGGLLLGVLVIWSVRIFYKFVFVLKFNNIWFIGFGLSLLSIFIIGLFDHYSWSLSSGIIIFWLILAIYYKIYDNITVEK
ncbi:MAG: O-antigen ligase family protein [bacterium]|nr:O-antigen ligase family protein [bacterium]